MGTYAKLPIEIWEVILDHLEHPFQLSRSQLTVCALVNKSFNHLVSSRLYRTVRVPPRYVSPCLDPENLAIFQGIANRPALGKYVHECWDEDYRNFDIVGEPSQFAEHSRVALAAFQRMTNLRILAVTPTSIGDYFVQTCHEGQWASLQELYIFGRNPLQFIWNPVKVSRSNMLSNLTTLVWTFYTHQFARLYYSFFPPPKGGSALIHTVSFLVAILEFCCPSLVHLKIFTTSSPGAMSAWKNSVVEWMANNQADFSDVFHRTNEAHTAAIPCKLVHLRTLVLDVFRINNGDDCRGLLKWATAFFGPQLHAVTTLHLPLPDVDHPNDQELLSQLCASAGRNIRALELHYPKGQTYSPLEPFQTGPFAALHTQFSSAPHQSMRTSLQSLTLHHPTPFSPETAREFQEFACLTSLSLCIYLPKSHPYIDEDEYFVREEFPVPLLNFVAQLPTTLESLKLASTPAGYFPDEEAVDLSVGGVAVCRRLPRLRSFDLDLEVQSLTGFPTDHPVLQVYIRRLSHWHSGREDKVVATTTFLNCDCLQMPDNAAHRWIVKREFTSVQSRSPHFEGSDEDEAYTYTSADIELIKRCDCKSHLELWDSRVGTWIEEQDDPFFGLSG